MCARRVSAVGPGMSSMGGWGRSSLTFWPTDGACKSEAIKRSGGALDTLEKATVRGAGVEILDGCEFDLGLFEALNRRFGG